jgi:hypothetical protein
MDLSSKSARVAMHASLVAMISVPIMAVLWMTGSIGDEAEGYWWLFPALFPLAAGIAAFFSYQLIPEEQRPGWVEVLCMFVAIGSVYSTVTQLNAGGLSENSYGSNILVGLYHLGIGISFKGVVPLYGRIATFVWGIVMFLDGFVHIFFGTGNGPEGINNGVLGGVEIAKTYDATLLPIGMIAAIVFFYTLQAGYRKVV